MATIKSYTDIHQSETLSKVLPLESADMWWVALNWQETEYYVEVKQDGINQPKKAVPCWSLPALLGVLEHPRCFQGDKPIYWFCGCFGKDELYHEVEADNPVDACVAMIERLHELNLL